MSKWLFILAGTAAAGYFAFKTYKDKFVENASEFIKENFSIQVAGAKVHRLDRTGLELRINADLINLSRIAVNVSELKAYVFWLKNGSPSHLATSTIKNKISIQARDTSRIRDLKISVPYISLLSNLGLFTAHPRQFKIVVKAVVNGQNVQFSNTLTA
jgi:hypothetical protein